MDAPDGQGGIERQYQSTATLWASLDAVRGRSAVAGDGLIAAITHRIVIRGGVDLTVRHRFRLGERVFVIHAFRARRDGALVDIDAEEIAF